jgi:hypothetical protein
MIAEDISAVLNHFGNYEHRSRLQAYFPSHNMAMRIGVSRILHGFSSHAYNAVFNTSGQVFSPALIQRRLKANSYLGAVQQELASVIFTVPQHLFPSILSMMRT